MKEKIELGLSALSEKEKAAIILLKNWCSIQDIFVKTEFPTREETKKFLNQLRKDEIAETKRFNGKKNGLLLFKLKQKNSIIPAEKIAVKQLQPPPKQLLLTAPLIFLITEGEAANKPQPNKIQETEKIYTEEKIINLCKNPQLELEGNHKRILLVLINNFLIEKEIIRISEIKGNIKGLLIDLVQKKIIKKDKRGKYMLIF